MGEKPYATSLVFFVFMCLLEFSEIQMVRPHSEVSKNFPYLISHDILLYILPSAKSIYRKPPHKALNFPIS